MPSAAYPSRLALCLAVALSWAVPAEAAAADAAEVLTRSVLARKRKKRPKPPPAPKAPEPQTSAPEPRPQGSPEPQGEEVARAPRGPTRIDFDDRLIQGQTNKSGAVYLFDRKELSVRSMVKQRTSFRDQIVRDALAE